MEINEKKTFEFRGQTYIAFFYYRSLPSRLYGFIRDIYYGIYYGYPVCCVWYFAQHSFLNVPVAAYDEVIKGKVHNLGRVVCDKCYKKLKLEQKDS